MKIREFAGYGDKMEQLMRSVQAGRIVHALLLVGPHGSGKRTMAGLLAQAMVCTGASKPCGACPACKRFLAESHPDVHRIVPEKKTIGVDEIRDLIDALSLSSYEGGRHIVLIEQADKMTPSAQNALLKTLENPVGDAMFFLITDAPGALLTTILSRCQTVRFSDLSVEDCAAVLQKRGIAPARAAELAGLSQGSVGRALEIDADAGFPALRERVLKSLETLKPPTEKNAKASVAEAAVLLEDDKGAENAMLEIMELWARDLMAVQSGGRPYQQSDDARLRRAWLDGRALLKGVVTLRQQLAGNVSWPNALENMYFMLLEPRNYRRTKLSWQR